MQKDNYFEQQKGRNTRDSCWFQYNMNSSRNQMGGQRLKDSRVMVRRVSFIRHKNKVRIKILYKRDRRKRVFQRNVITIQIVQRNLITESILPEYYLSQIQRELTCCKGRKVLLTVTLMNHINDHNSKIPRNTQQWCLCPGSNHQPDNLIYVLLNRREFLSDTVNLTHYSWLMKQWVLEENILFQFSKTSIICNCILIIYPYIYR